MHECRLTIERYAQKESIGDVDHGAAEQVEDVHVAENVQLVQVVLGGGDADLHRLLQARTCQG